MTMLKRFLMAFFALLFAMPSAFAQASRVYGQAELDQMLAPIALYPDPLLSQVLMAATYPLEVAEAARWSRANPGLQGDDAVRAAQDEDWDPSVKSLLAFPQLLQRMDENRDWTRVLGDAFLGQEAQVMDTVQQLRRRAQAAGNLQSNDQFQVRQQGQAILVQPVNPEYVYVPYYDPLVAYGPWWWPAYRPVYWSPWPRPYAVRVSFGFFFGNFDWRGRRARVVNVNNYYYRPPLLVNRAVAVAPERWQHDPAHRRGVSYRAPEVQQRFAETRPRRVEERRREELRRPEERHQVLSQPRSQLQAPQVRQETRQRMPQAVAPQQPRADRQDVRREHRGEQRNERGERGAKGKDRS